MQPLFVCCIKTAQFNKIVICTQRDGNNQIQNTEASVVASKEMGLAVNAADAKYMVMSADQNAGRSHDIKIDNSSMERAEQFKYLVRALTNKNFIQEETKSRLKSGNAFK